MRRNIPTLSEFDGCYSWWGGLKGYLLCGFCGTLIGAMVTCTVYEIRLDYMRREAIRTLQEMFEEKP